MVQIRIPVRDICTQKLTGQHIINVARFLSVFFFADQVAQFPLVLCPCLLQNIGDVILCCRNGDDQICCDICCFVFLQDFPQHFRFPVGEAITQLIFTQPVAMKGTGFVRQRTVRFYYCFGSCFCSFRFLFYYDVWRIIFCFDCRILGCFGCKYFRRFKGKIFPDFCFLSNIRICYIFCRHSSRTICSCCVFIIFRCKYFGIILCSSLFGSFRFHFGDRFLHGGMLPGLRAGTVCTITRRPV